MHRFARAYKECTAGHQFYKCRKGPFEGCCASDPCTTGICPDEDQPEDDSSSSSQSPKTETTTSTSDDSTTSTTSESPTFTTSSSLIPTTSSPSSTTASIISSISSIPTSTETGVTGLPEQPDSPPVNGELIGGIVGGVVGGLVVICLFIFWCIRRRRKRKSESMAASSYSRLQRPMDPPGEITIPDRSQDDEGEKPTGELEGSSNARNSKAVSELYASSDRSTLISSLRVSRISPSIGSPVTAVSPMPRESFLTALNENSSSDSQDGHEGFMTPRSQLQPHPYTASELNDTSRVELPSDNNNHHQNHGDEETRESNPQNGADTAAQSKEIGSGMVSRALSVTTPDGIVLKPNLNQADEQGKGTSMAESHVMSFMDYQGKESPTKMADP